MCSMQMHRNAGPAFFGACVGRHGRASAGRACVVPCSRPEPCVAMCRARPAIAARFSVDGALDYSLLLALPDDEW